MGRLLEKALDNIDDLFEYMSRFMIGRDFASYSDLATAVGLTKHDIATHPDRTDPYILVTGDNSFLTVFEIKGIFQILSPEGYQALIERLQSRMSGYFNRDGHSISIVFEKDHAHGRRELERLAAPAYATAKRIGLSTDDIITSRLDRNEPFVAREQCLIVMYTHLSILSKSERKQTIAQHIERTNEVNLQKIHYAQNPFAATMEILKLYHDVFIEKLQQDMNDCGAGNMQGIMLSPLSAHEATKRIHSIVNPEQASESYRPNLPGDNFTPSGFHEDDDDISAFLPPLLSFQICNKDINVHTNFVHTGEYYHGTITMELGPKDIKPFSALFESIHHSIPWRVRYDLMPNGLDKVKGRKVLAQFTHMSGDNMSIYKSIEQLGELTKEDSAVCAMKVNFCTWAKTKEQASKQVNGLVTAIRSWGQSNVTTSVGDPLESWGATIPAFSKNNPANMLVPPLRDALRMMPLNRPTTPWAEGSMYMRTPDGKIFPIQPGSSIQKAYLETITSPSGGGKSLLLSNMLYSEIHSAGRNKLPLITIIDVGPSSEGLILLLRDSLPEERKEEAVYLQLYNDQAYAVNPFDTQLGARRPTLREEEFLINLITLLCTDPSSKEAPRACADIVPMLLDIVYRRASDPSSCKQYDPGDDPAIHEMLQRDDISSLRDASWWEQTPSWFDITDILFEAGHHHLATRAQRFAVPTLKEVIGALNQEEVIALYNTALTDNGEPLLDYMTRSLTAALRKFAVLSSRTRFDIGSQTRVIAINLHHVRGTTTNQGELTTSVMYMFSRQLAARNYFLSEELIIDVTPPLYHAYHRARVEDIAQERKIIAYDEFHNTGGQDALVKSIECDSREGRKWNIRIILSSQYLRDFTDILLSSVTSVYVMSHSKLDEDILRNKMHVSNAVLEEFKRRANSSEKHREGSNFLALFETERGSVAHILTNTVGAYELWAYTTTPADMALRNKLYKNINTKAARMLLVKHFPTGSAVKHIDRLKEESAGNDTTSAIDHICHQLVAEYTNNIRTEEENQYEMV